MELFENISLSAEEESLFSTTDDNMVFADDAYSTSAWATINQAGTQHASSNSDTVSPHEVLKDYAPSAPSSTAFPNLSTPGSVYESPFYQSSGLNTSPLEDGALDGDLNTAEWSSAALFPDTVMESFASNMPTEPGSVDTSFTSSASPLVRQKSSPGRPPTYDSIPGRKHSNVAGIKANKCRSKPLPDIVVDQNDDKDTAKRKKNTAAARKSRERKLNHTQALEARIAELENDKTRLEAKILDAGLSLDD